MTVNHTSGEQITLFDIPRYPQRTCARCRSRLTGPPIPGTFTDCPACDIEAISQFMRNYADQGCHGTRKRPGMSFPSGATVPTPEESAQAHELLDQLGFPRYAR